MSELDPFTGRPLPPNSIQRILFVTPKVHIYQIPPLTSTKGFNAGPWTAPPNPTAKQIFTARLRILETSSSAGIKVDILLEDPGTAELFAAAPYTSPAVVQPALDSSRFFAIRVSDPSGNKATLGIGFEERSEAFDFGIALGDERRVLGLDGQTAPVKKSAEPVKDYGLKDGESIHIELGSKGHRTASTIAEEPRSTSGDNSALFSIAPPPSAGASGGLSTPSSAAHDTTQADKLKAQELGFDDGEFGEFQ